MPAELTLPQMKALHGAGMFVVYLVDTAKPGRRIRPAMVMRRLAGRSWKRALIRSLAEVGRELAREAHLRRKR